MSNLLTGPWQVSPNTIDVLAQLRLVVGDLMLRVDRLEQHVARLEHFYPTNGHADKIHLDAEHTCPRGG